MRAVVAMQGRVACWHEDRGFGFITPDDGDQDVFVHCRHIEGASMLTIGQRVEFTVGHNRIKPGRLEAKGVRVVAPVG